MKDVKEIAEEIVIRVRLENLIAAALQAERDRLVLDNANLQLHWNEERDALRARVDQAEARFRFENKECAAWANRAETAEHEIVHLRIKLAEACRLLQPLGAGEEGAIKFFHQHSPELRDSVAVKLTTTLGHCRSVAAFIKQHSAI